MGLAAIADPFVEIAFGEKFGQSAIYMTISAFSIFPLVVANFLPNLLISQAKTKDAFNIVLINIFCNILIASCTIWFGITVMLYSIVIGNFLATPVRLAIVRRHIYIDTKKLFLSLSPSFISALGMFTVVTLLKSSFEDYFELQLLTLFACILVGIIAYVSISFLFFYKHTVRQLKELQSMLFKEKLKKTV